MAAGVHHERALVFARNALRDPAVKAGYEHCVRTRFAEAGPIALNVLLKFAKNERNEYKPELQLQAARDLASRSGYTAKEMRESEPAKDLKELSRDELHAALQSTEAELANRAKVPVIGASATQVIDLEG